MLLYDRVKVLVILFLLEENKELANLPQQWQIFIIGRKHTMANNSELIMYTTEDGLTKVDVTFDHDTVWLSLDQMAELFQRDKSTVSRHIRHIFEDGELSRNSTVANFATVQMEGLRSVERIIEFYNLDVIISVGYRVKSQRGVQFRIWASNILKEYMKKGFVMDDARLKKLGGEATSKN